MDKVSIVMPLYNAEQFVEESIKSVINQSHKLWELIIIEDGSEDDSPSIAKKYESIDKRIKVYCNEINSGVSYSRNKGINLANNKWIAFIDSDDIWNPLKLEKQLKFSREHKATFVCTGSEYIDENSKFYPGSFSPPFKIDYELLQLQNVISTSSVLIKKDIIGKYRFEGDNVHEDYVLWLRLLSSGTIAYGCKDSLLIYRLYKDSKSGNKLRTFRMTYGAFRLSGFNRIKSLSNTTKHITNSVKKYYKIFNG